PPPAGNPPRKEIGDSIMNRFTATLYLATVLLPMAAFGDPNAGHCAAGTLLDVQVATEMIPIGTAENAEQREKKNGRREYHSYSTTITQEQKTYTVTVQLDDLVYTAQAVGILGFGFKPTAFVVNDPVRACVRGNVLALARPDGK